MNTMLSIPSTSFSAACSQFVHAGYDILSAVWQAPFSGGKIRMVAIGLPLLFLTAAAGAAIYTIMTTIIGAAYGGCKSGANALNRCFTKKAVCSLCSEHTQMHRSRVRRELPSQPIPALPSPQDSQKDDSVNEIQPLVMLPPTPLPQNAAKERNHALLKFVDLVDLHLIEPWIIQNKQLMKKAQQTEDPLLKEMINDPATLKSWLRSMALWQLGMEWDKLEEKYVQMETPEPPTLTSLELQIQATQIKSSLSTCLITLLTSEDIDKVSQFQRAVTESQLAEDQKMTLMGISLQFSIIISEKSVKPPTHTTTNDKIRSNFATIMHHGMAVSLTQISVIIKGWMTVMDQVSSHTPRLVAQQTVQQEALPPRNAPSNFIHTQLQPKIDFIVQSTCAVLSEELSTKYLLPLWEKQQKKWKHSLEASLKKAGIHQDTNIYQYIKQFMTNSEITEEAFLVHQDSAGLSTELTANIAFIRSMQMLESKKIALKATISTLPNSLLLQIKSVLTSILYKSTKMMSEIHLETTIPRITDYALDLLDCCEAMQLVQNNHLLQDNQQSYTVLISALCTGQEAACAEKQIAQRIAQLYRNLSKRIITGCSVIDRLGTKAHKAVRLSQSDIRESTWIYTTKERLKGLLRVKAAEHTQDSDGQWLNKLLNSQPNDNSGKNLIASLLSIQSKLWNFFPGAESIAKILVMGLQTFVEAAACNGIQSQLNQRTSTAFLSSMIGTTLVKELVDQSKESSAWEKNLPLLQQAYAFLSPEEQQSVLRHLSAQYVKADELPTRQTALAAAPTQNQKCNTQIATLKEEKKMLDQSLEKITQAYNLLKKTESPNSPNSIALQEAYNKIKRAKDLNHFERIKGLVMHVADHYLSTLLNFRGGDTLKQVILAVIYEVYTLLSYQEVVKHWIFTIVDLLLDELEEATSQNPPSLHSPGSRTKEVSLATQTPSMLDFIQQAQKTQLLEKLANITTTTTRNRTESGWFSIHSWVFSGMRVMVDLAPKKTIWNQIETMFKKKLQITPAEMTTVLLTKFQAFATDPTRLSDIIMQTLVENVADPRQIEPPLCAETLSPNDADDVS